ncbi:hypothetical protein [Amycolatopsis sp. 195334CR]|uniref:hypothetical protein n=1 Tax=Amycolatopsis sp. 195334CR TaxID=2814588 RepID=UPI001A8EDB95|nr:hypothetical protein [Amycolatopsis sp. 195334CR]MBN6041076.1 hypothetical protein [Amycolatopsis sp. 195334CR]
MRTAESVRRRSTDRRRTPPLPHPGTPRSLAVSPAVVLPHPPLGWEPAAVRALGKSLGTALTWTLVFGPLGLCYLSIAFGLVATTAAVVAVVVGGAALVAVIWPVAMVLALLTTPRRN